MRLVIDHHFSERGSYPRLSGLLEDNLDLIGVGIDENTLVLIDTKILSILGEVRATVLVGPRVPDEAPTVYRLKSGEVCGGKSDLSRR